MGKISVDLTDDKPSVEPLKSATEDAKLKALASGLPSAGKARSEGLKYAERVNWSFTNIPAPVKARTIEKAAEMQMGIKEFFYHCLRLGGVEIPDYEDIDGRRR